MQSRPVTVSVKRPVCRSCTPANVTVPVTRRKTPVPVRLVEVERNAPDTTSNVPTVCAVSLPIGVVNTIGPVNEAVVPEMPVITNEALVVPSRRPCVVIVAVVLPPPRSCPTPCAWIGTQIKPAPCAGAAIAADRLRVATVTIRALRNVLTSASIRRGMGRPYA